MPSTNSNPDREPLPDSAASLSQEDTNIDVDQISVSEFFNRYREFELQPKKPLKPNSEQISGGELEVLKDWLDLEGEFLGRFEHKLVGELNTHIIELLEKELLSRQDWSEIFYLVSCCKPLDEEQTCFLNEKYFSHAKELLSTYLSCRENTDEDLNLVVSVVNQMKALPTPRENWYDACFRSIEVYDFKAPEVVKDQLFMLWRNFLTAFPAPEGSDLHSLRTIALDELYNLTTEDHGDTKVDTFDREEVALGCSISWLTAILVAAGNRDILKIVPYLRGRHALHLESGLRDLERNSWVNENEEDSGEFKYKDERESVLGLIEEVRRVSQAGT